MYPLRKVNTKRLMSLFALFALALNTLLPFFTIYGTSQAMATQFESSLLLKSNTSLNDKILICTSSGFKWVSWKELQNGNIDGSEKPLPKPHTKYQCPLCLLAEKNSDSFITADNDLITSVRFRLNDQKTTPTTAIVQRYVLQRLQARAPPFLA